MWTSYDINNQYSHSEGIYEFDTKLHEFCVGKGFTEPNCHDFETNGNFSQINYLKTGPENFTKGIKHINKRQAETFWGMKDCGITQHDKKT